MMNNTKKIGIIGAGPGGLTLARILEQAGFSSIIFEGEFSSTAREQGGTLDLAENMGQKAVKAAGLFEEFEKICRHEGEALRITNKKAEILLEDRANENPEEATDSRPEVDRTDLRKMLLDSVNPESIKWGYKLKYAETLENGQQALHFENGKTEVVDLAVGADGAFSKLRPLVSAEKPYYSGVSMIEINIMNAPEVAPELVAFNGLGSMFALDDEKGMLAQMNGHGKIRVYLSFKTPYEWLRGNNINYEDLEEAKPALLALYEDWSPTLKQYIEEANGEIFPRHIYMLPVPHTWTHKQGVTLIGDAAHLMSPFAGAGVNLAMLDAMELAHAIIANPSNLDLAVQTYEEKMFNYAGKMAAVTKNSMELFFSENAAQKLADMFTLVTQ